MFSGARELWTFRWVVSHLLVVSMVTVLIGLGFWQLHRLDEKRTDNEAIRLQMSDPLVDISGRMSSSQGPVSSNGLAGFLPDYTTVTATGIYRVDSEVLIGHRSYKSQPGWWVATPLELSDGRTVIVVRGWSPLSDKADTSTPPTGEVTITGLIFTSQKNGRVAAGNPGEPVELTLVDVDLFEDVFGVKTIGVWIQLLHQEPPQTGYPVPVPSPDLSDGPHLSYAFQWFFFAVSSVVVYILVLRSRVYNARRRSRAREEGGSHA